MSSMNVFRVLADICHTLSKGTLIWAIHKNRSAEGVSFITQSLYLLVFLTRYLDLFWTAPWSHWWNFILKNVYIWSSVYILAIMYRAFARTREREKAWRLTAYTLGGSILAAPFVTWIYYWSSSVYFAEILYTFSLILEAFCVIPQLLLLRQTNVPTVIDSFYLVFLGSYRAFYIMNWIYKATQNVPTSAISIICGVIQTLFYLDFAWVYWSRQRVKLRGGAIVDSDDLGKGFLVNRFAHGRASVDEEAGAGAQSEVEFGHGPNKSSRWGARGVSIRADDTLDEHEGTGRDVRGGSRPGKAASPLKDPDQFLSDEEDDAPELNSVTHENLNDDHEWRGV